MNYGTLQQHCGAAMSPVMLNDYGNSVTVPQLITGTHCGAAIDYGKTHIAVLDCDAAIDYENKISRIL